MRAFASRWIARLGGLMRRQSESVAEVSAGTCVYAVGDIHGRVDLLAILHRHIQSDADRRQPMRKVVVYIGDYVDRGEDSRRVLDLLLDDPLPDFEHVHLLGNHEQRLLQFLGDATVGPPWMQFGGDAALYSYGVRPPQPTAPAAEFERARQQFVEKFPSRHRRFLEGLVYTHVEGDYFFAHAGVRPGVPLAAQAPTDLLWIRDDFLHSEEFHGKIVVHGHSITPRPEVRRNRIGIDTGAFASGRLTCLVLEGSGRAFLQT
jgi:serine/threonine protein phosphatase 1